MSVNKILVLLAFFCFGTNVQIRAQIVNVEALRMQTDSTGFYGREMFSLNFVKNTQRFLSFNNNLAFQYKTKKHLYFLVSDINLSVGDSDSYENSSYYHGRYNYALNKRVALEGFLQYQTNFPLRIQDRILAGVGTRVELHKKEGSNIIFGSALMYEFDNELAIEQNNEAIRASFYFSYGLKKKERYQLSTVAYYQPDIGYWKDYRLSAQLLFDFNLWKGLQFSARAGVNYDAFPVDDPDIPKLTYRLSNGLTYAF